MFGNPETTPGGRALKFYASVRLDIRRIETIKTGTESVGNRVRVKVVKNKVAPPFRVAEFDVMYGEGISKEGGLLDVGVAMDVVNKTGAWFTFDETRLGQGREASKEFLKGERRDRRRDRPPHPRPDRRGRGPGRGHRRGRVGRGCGRAGSRDRRSPATPRVVRRATGPARGHRRSRGRPGGRVPLPRGAGASVTETRRRLSEAGYRPELIEGAIDRLLEIGHARRRGVRPALGGVARPGTAARARSRSSASCGCAAWSRR